MKNLFYLHIYLSFLVLKHLILSGALILPVSQLQTQQVMTSQSRSHVEYLMGYVAYFLGHPV